MSDNKDLTERAKIDTLAKNLYMWSSGLYNEEELEKVWGVTLTSLWDKMPEWERDDYRYAVKRLTEEIMYIFEKVDTKPLKPIPSDPELSKLLPEDD